MKRHTYPAIEQRSVEWYEQRRGIVTASAVHKLLTPTLKVAENDTSRGYIATLAAERISGHVEDTPVSSDMFRGIMAEPFARDVYSGHYQQAVECGFMTLEHDGWTLGYSPDGLVGTDGLIEIKAPRQKTHLRTILDGCVPDQYMAQCQAGLLVSGRDWIDFVSYVGGMPLFVSRVEPSPLWRDALLAAVTHAEVVISELVTAYQTSAAGLPATERIDFDLEVI